MAAAGEVGYFLIEDSRVASHAWLILNPGPGTVDRRYLRIYPGEAYLHYLHTYPPYRRRGLAQYLVTRVALREDEDVWQGISILKSSVLAENEASLALMRNVGALRVGRSADWRILGLYLRFIHLEEVGQQLKEVRW